ncbi:MAG: phosphotransferase family protein [Anaerolineae bacterium]
MELTEPGARAEALLRPLLDHLARRRPTAGATWGDWSVEPVGGGANNLLYRVQCPPHDLMVKFAIRDERDRAGREFLALQALCRADLPVAPRPLLLDRDAYEQPVVVQTYLPGEVSVAPPASDEEWMRLVEHLLITHSVTPESSDVPLPRANVDAGSAAEARQLVWRQVDRIPAAARPRSLMTLVERMDAAVYPEWLAPSLALCHVDYNTRNLVRRPGLWASVDWENSGWGDPAFDVADLMLHPAYLGVSGDRWHWFVDEYAARSADVGCLCRIWVYARILAVYWVARLARYLHEVPLGLDQRLVERPGDWEIDRRNKYDYYARAADIMYRRGSDVGGPPAPDWCECRLQ